MEEVDLIVKENIGGDGYGNADEYNAIDGMGDKVFPEQINEDEDPILAILNDDRIVLIVGHQRISVGCAIAGRKMGRTWFWINEQQGPSGFYEMIMDIPSAVEIVTNNRQKSGRAFKLFNKNHSRLGVQLLYEIADGGTELYDEIVADGIMEWLENIK